MSSETVTAPLPRRALGHLHRALGVLGPLLALLLVVVFFSVADRLLAEGFFTTVRNLRVVLAQTSIVAVAALGMTLVIIAGGIDLSAGTAMTLCTTVMALCFKHEVGPLWAVAATLGTGCLCGLINGTLISLMRMAPFIVTLGTMTIFLGAGKKLAGESTIFPDRQFIPQWLQNLCSTMPPDWIGFPSSSAPLVQIPNLAAGVWIALALAIAVAAILHLTIFGRHLFAIGSNESTARLCGVNVSLTKVAVYTLAGLLVAVAGIYHFAILKIANPTEGLGLELKFIAAVVIGGGSLNGGRGSVIGTLAGAAIMGVMTSGCDQLEVPNPYQDMLIGAIIITAVAVDQYRQGRATLQ